MEYIWMKEDDDLGVEDGGLGGVLLEESAHVQALVEVVLVGLILAAGGLK